MLVCVAACGLTGTAFAGPEEPPLFALVMKIGEFGAGFVVFDERTDVQFGSMHHWFLVHWLVTAVIIGFFCASVTYAAFLFYQKENQMKTETNKAMEPTPVAVTDRAYARSARATRLAHLWR